MRLLVEILLAAGALLCVGGACVVWRRYRRGQKTLTKIEQRNWAFSLQIALIAVLIAGALGFAGVLAGLALGGSGEATADPGSSTTIRSESTTSTDASPITSEATASTTVPVTSTTASTSPPALPPSEPETVGPCPVVPLEADATVKVGEECAETIVLSTAGDRWSVIGPEHGYANLETSDFRVPEPGDVVDVGNLAGYGQLRNDEPDNGFYHAIYGLRFVEDGRSPLGLGATVGTLQVRVSQLVPLVFFDGDLKIESLDADGDEVLVRVETISEPDGREKRLAWDSDGSLCIDGKNASYRVTFPEPAGGVTTAYTYVTLVVTFEAFCPDF